MRRLYGGLLATSEEYRDVLDMTCVLGGPVSIKKEEAREPLYKKLTDKNEETCRYQFTEKETFS